MFGPPQENPNDKRRMLITLGVVAGLALLAVALVGGLAIIRIVVPPKFASSPTVEMFAPTEKSMFKNGLYTSTIMLYIERELMGAEMMADDREAVYDLDLETLLAQGIIEDRARADGWERPLQYDPAAGEILSAGADGEFGTADDILHVLFTPIELPGVYWAEDGSFERRAQDSLWTQFNTAQMMANEMMNNARMMDRQLDGERERMEAGEYDELDASEW
jgi:hypothetical protein